jgi:general secretion pathway protein G
MVHLLRVPLDPWSRPYVYESTTAPHATVRVLTYGADGAPGGVGRNADVVREIALH